MCRVAERYDPLEVPLLEYVLLQSCHDCDFGPAVQFTQLQARHHRFIGVFSNDASLVVFGESGGVLSVSRLVQVQEEEPVQPVVDSGQDGENESIVVSHHPRVHLDFGRRGTDAEDGRLETRYG